MIQSLYENNSAARAQSLRSIIVIGGGLGGLALAQRMRKLQADTAQPLRFTLFERDASPASREQGYHIGINAAGLGALRATAVPRNELDRLFGQQAVDGFALVNSQLRPLLRFSGASSIVSRVELRKLLTHGLETHIVWNKRFIRYEELPDRVIAHFEDGTCAEADLLIGADGANSRVRQQRCPQLYLETIGVTNLFGVIPTPPAAEIPIFSRIARTDMVRTLGQGKTVLLFSYREADGTSLTWWVMSLRTVATKQLPIPHDPNELKAYAEAISREFHPEIQHIVKHTPEISRLRELRSIQPTQTNPLTPTSRVTLLGDAAHAMTTHRGLGANTAFTDAVDLAAALTETADDPFASLATYEDKMIRRGFKAVKDSRQSTEMITMRGFPAVIRNGALKTVGAVMRAKQKWPGHSAVL